MQVVPLSDVPEGQEYVGVADDVVVCEQLLPDRVYPAEQL
jgi:hypothetical protein